MPLNGGLLMGTMLALPASMVLIAFAPSIFPLLVDDTTRHDRMAVGSGVNSVAVPRAAYAVAWPAAPIVNPAGDGRWQIYDTSLPPDGWTEGSGQMLWPLLDRYLAVGAVEFLCTDIAKDGTLEGPNVDLYESCAREYPAAQFIASGGVSAAADLEALDATGVARVVTGKALLDGRLTLEEIEQFSRDA